MGVMSCDRLGCENIMCQRMTPCGNYICWECVSEFQTVMGGRKRTVSKFKKKLEKFLKTRKPDEKPDEEDGITAYDFIHEHIQNL